MCKSWCRSENVGCCFPAYSSKKKYCPARFCSTSWNEINFTIDVTWNATVVLTLTDRSLLMRGRKLLGSRRKVIPRSCKKRFMPLRRASGVWAVVLTDGLPSKTITRSARYVAMMKSCSTMKPVFFEWRMNLKVEVIDYFSRKRRECHEPYRLMTLAATKRCSESR